MHATYHQTSRHRPQMFSLRVTQLRLTCIHQASYATLSEGIAQKISLGYPAGHKP